MKNSNDTITNRTRALPTCSALRHRVPLSMIVICLKKQDELLGSRLKGESLH